MNCQTIGWIIVLIRLCMFITAMMLIPVVGILLLKLQRLTKQPMHELLVEIIKGV